MKNNDKLQVQDPKQNQDQSRQDSSATWINLLEFENSAYYSNISGTKYPNSNYFWPTKVVARRIPKTMVISDLKSVMNCNRYEF